MDSISVKPKKILIKRKKKAKLGAEDVITYFEM